MISLISHGDQLKTSIFPSIKRGKLKDKGWPEKKTHGQILIANVMIYKHLNYLIVTHLRASAQQWRLRTSMAVLKSLALTKTAVIHASTILGGEDNYL